MLSTVYTVYTQYNEVKDATKLHCPLKKNMSPSDFQIGPISSANSAPLYQQVVEGVIREVRAGRLKAGESMPSLRELSAEQMVSMITVKRAYEELERMGMIYRRQGLGTFVSESPQKSGDADIEELEKDLAQILHQYIEHLGSEEARQRIQTIMNRYED